MKKSKIVLIAVIGIVILILVTAISLGAYWFTQRQQAKAQNGNLQPEFPPAPQPLMMAYLDTSDMDRTIETGDTIPLSGNVLSSSPIVCLELWINGQKVDERVPADGWEKTSFKALWNWTPPTAGTYELITRGIDLKGVSNYSNMVTITVGQVPMDADGKKVMPTPDMADFTKESNADPDPASLPFIGELAEPGEIDPQAEKSVMGPMGVVTSPNNIPPQPEPDDPVEEMHLAVQGINYADCVHGIEITNSNPDISYYYIYVNSPIDGNGFFATGFIENSQKDGKLWTVYLDSTAKVLGKYQYYVTGITSSGGETSSEIVEVFQKDASCTNKEWNGYLFVDIKLVPKGNYENLYCYARLNDLPWERMPALDNNFLAPMNDQEYDNWQANLSFTTFDFNPEAGTKVYDLNPFAPNFSQAGWDKFTFSIKCADIYPDDFVSLGIAEVDIDLKKIDDLTVIQSDNFNVLIYLNSKSNTNTGSNSGTTLRIAPPYNLTASRNPDECPAGSSSTCVDGISQNKVMLKWEWDPSRCHMHTNAACLKTPIGFRIYRYSYPESYVVATIPTTEQNDTDGYFYMIDYPTDDSAIKETDSESIKSKKQALNQKAFFVTAYSTNLESDNSGVVRLEAPPVVKTLTLSTTKTNVYINHSSSGDDTHDANGLGIDNLSENMVYSGFAIGSNSDGWGNSTGYGMFKYDLSSLEGKNIISAKLNIQSHTGLMTITNADDLDDKYVENRLCATMLMANNRDYRSTSQYPYPPVATIVNNFVHDEMDVTNLVKMWLDGSMKNYGFSFWTENPYSVVSNQNYECDSTYGPINLIVEYTD